MARKSYTVLGFMAGFPNQHNHVAGDGECPASCPVPIYKKTIDYLEGLKMEAKKEAYDDVASKGGKGDTVRQYAKSRSSLLDAQLDSLQETS